MYSFADLIRAVKSPRTAGRELNRLYHQRLGRWQCNQSGVDVFNEDWDSLIILDACRFDYYQKHADINGVLETRISRGAATKEWVRANFGGRQLHDTVYVTSNSWLLKLQDEIDTEVHDVIHIPKPPHEVTERALDVAEEYPHKRLVVHFIPPHHPFVGPTADEYLPEYDEQLDNLFGKLESGVVQVPDEKLQQAYVENLERVLPEVEKLLSELEGKTVVTADHGELLGDRCSPVPVKGYGHHVGLYVPELVRVPWHIHSTGDRRDIRSDVPANSDTVSDKKVDQRLENLGYKL